MVGFDEDVALIGLDGSGFLEIGGDGVGCSGCTDRGRNGSLSVRLLG